MDIKALDGHGDIVIIEVQNTYELAYMERILYGVSKAITEHITTGQGYEHVKKVISISIVYFSLGKGADYLYRGVTSFIGVHTHDELMVSQKQRDALVRKPASELFPEYYIIRVNEFNDVATTPLEEWVRYLRTGVIEDSDTAPGLPEARQRLRYYDMSPSEKKAYDDHLDDLLIQKNAIADSKAEGRAEGRKEGLAEGRKEGLAEGRKEGLAEGRKEGLAEGLAEGHTKGLAEGMAKANTETAAKLKKLGVDVAAIAEATGLSTEQI